MLAQLCVEPLHDDAGLHLDEVELGEVVTAVKARLEALSPAGG